MDDSATLFHVANSFLSYDEYAGHAHRDHPLVIFETDSFDWTAEGQTCVIDQHVNATVDLYSAGNSSTHGGCITSVGQDGDGTTTFVFNCLCNLLGQAAFAQSCCTRGAEIPSI